MAGDPRRILLIRPSALGDVCRTVPVLVSLRRRFPQAEIDWMVRDVFTDAVSAHPDLTRVVPFAREGLSRWWTPGGAVKLLRWFRSLRKTHYDVVIDCQGLARSGIFTFVTGASTRIGSRQASEGAWLAYTTKVEVDETKHVVDRALALVETIGADPVREMQLYTPAGTAFADDRLTEGAYAVIAPTSAWPGKCWPADRFSRLAQRLLDESLVDRIAVVGTGGEREQVSAVLKVCEKNRRVVDLVGKTSVSQLMKVIEHAGLVVANDSAAMHMAVGFDRPLVALLGPTDADLAGPYNRRQSVVQIVEPSDQLSHRACKDDAVGSAMMDRITVENALNVARRELDAMKRAVGDTDNVSDTKTASESIAP